jgi:hypothetical protein
MSRVEGIIVHTRRRILQLGALGLSLPCWLQLEAAARAVGAGKQPKSFIFLFLYGGPSHIDTWDMKPDAPVEFRGEFKPCDTAVPGMRIVEHLPRMARMAKHYSVIRSLHHHETAHVPAATYLLTGAEPPRTGDPPAFGALLSRLAPGPGAGVPPFVALPARVRDLETLIRGQGGGWLGRNADPLFIHDDPNAPTFKVDSLGSMPDLPRALQRQQLLGRLDQGLAADDSSARTMSQFQEKAFDLIVRSKGQSAFNMSQEPTAVRERYGRTTFGQGCLLARRLIEAGARVVTVSDCSPITGTHNWDTHSANFKKLKDTLLPCFDQAFTALLQDLIERGLLEETVVLAVGEFGRTPRIGQASAGNAAPDGRDHYGNCFSGILAGGSIRSGMVYGMSNSKAAYPSRDPVSVEDLTATLLAALGLNPSGMLAARDGRPVPITHGRPVAELLR